MVSAGGFFIYCAMLRSLSLISGYLIGSIKKDHESLTVKLGPLGLLLGSAGGIAPGCPILHFINHDRSIGPDTSERIH
jgi:hypothetical protein